MYLPVSLQFYVRNGDTIYYLFDKWLETVLATQSLNQIISTPQGDFLQTIHVRNSIGLPKFPLPVIKDILSNPNYEDILWEVDPIKIKVKNFELTVDRDIPFPTEIPVDWNVLFLWLGKTNRT